MTVFFVPEGLACGGFTLDRLSFLRQLIGGSNVKSPKGLLTLVRVLRDLGSSRRPKDVIPS